MLKREELENSYNKEIERVAEEYKKVYEELARAMFEEFKKHTTNVSIEGACVTIQYEWGVLPMYEIQWIYSDVRAFM